MPRQSQLTQPRPAAILVAGSSEPLDAPVGDEGRTVPYLNLGLRAETWRSRNHVLALARATSIQQPFQPSRRRARSDAASLIAGATRVRLPRRSRAPRKSAPDLHRPFSHSHARPTDFILTNEFAASVLEGGPDRPHCTSPNRLPALKAGNGISRYMRGARQITHAPSQSGAGHSALYRQQFVSLF